MECICIRLHFRCLGRPPLLRGGLVLPASVLICCDIFKQKRLDGIEGDHYLVVPDIRFIAVCQIEDRIQKFCLLIRIIH